MEESNAGLASDMDKAATTYNAVEHAAPDAAVHATPSETEATVAGSDIDGDIVGNLQLPGNLPSIVDIKRALPSHIFESHVSTSLYYALKDIVQVVVTFAVAEWLWSSSLVPFWALWVLLPIYWLLQGTFFTAVFVIGHDAGHASFSHHNLLNDVMGTIFHTFLLCPFYCWKVSHRHHHKNTGNLDKDEVFYPIRKKDDDGNHAVPGFGLGIGWFVYLWRGYGPFHRRVHHFSAADPMFTRHIPACALSIACVAVWATVLWQYAAMYGFWKLFVHYIVPDFIFASYTVIITFLHHTEEKVPWYADSHWDNVRGQLSSVDRHYGWCHNIIHNIGTHQIHHLFTKVPHYHLEEATRIFRQRFPDLVQVRKAQILPAFCRMFRKYVTQGVISDSAPIHVYK